MAPGIPFFQCPTSGAQPSNSGFSCGKCPKKMKHGDNSLEIPWNWHCHASLAEVCHHGQPIPKRPVTSSWELALSPGDWTANHGKIFIGHAWTPSWLPYVTTCYHMLPWFLETLPGPRTSSDLEPRWTRYDPPMRPMVLKSKNDIWPLGEVHDLEVRGFGATFWSFPGCKNNGQSGVVEIFSKVSRRVFFEFWFVGQMGI